MVYWVPWRKHGYRRCCESLAVRCLPSWPCHMVLAKEPAPGDDAAVWWQEIHRHSSMAKQDRRGMRASLLQCKNNRPNMSTCSMTETDEWEEKNGDGSNTTCRLNYKVHSDSFVLCAAIKTNVFFILITLHRSLLASCSIKHHNKRAALKSVFL